jgi:hypothetical protein
MRFPEAGHQAASAECEDWRIARKSRLKGGCSQDWLPHTERPHAG